MKTGTAPDSITTWVCSEVPEAMLVRAQALFEREVSRSWWGESERRSLRLKL